MFQINADAFTLQPAGSVVKADQYQAYLDAREIVEQARREAEGALPEPGAPGQGRVRERCKI